MNINLKPLMFLSAMTIGISSPALANDLDMNDFVDVQPVATVGGTNFVPVAEQQYLAQYEGKVAAVKRIYDAESTVGKYAHVAYNKAASAASHLKDNARDYLWEIGKRTVSHYTCYHLGHPILDGTLTAGAYTAGYVCPPLVPAFYGIMAVNDVVEYIPGAREIKNVVVAEYILMPVVNKAIDWTPTVAKATYKAGKYAVTQGPSLVSSGVKKGASTFSTVKGWFGW